MDQRISAKDRLKEAGRDGFRRLWLEIGIFNIEFFQQFVREFVREIFIISFRQEIKKL